MSHPIPSDEGSLPEQRCADGRGDGGDGSVGLRAGRLPRRPRHALDEPRARRRPEPRRRPQRWSATSGGVWSTASRSRRGTRDHPEIEQLPVRGPVDITRPAAHRHHRARQHAVARPAVPLPARVGAVASRVPRRRWMDEATDPRRLSAASPMNEAVSTELKAMHLYETRRHDRGHRSARHGVPRPAVHAARLRLPRLVAVAPTCTDTFRYHRRVAQAAPVATPAGPAGCSRRRTTTSTWRRSSRLIPTCASS